MAKRKRKDTEPDVEIEKYREKRNFSQTPEPPAEPKTRTARRRSRKPPAFVVHRHEARRLHYDLRIEMNGVLKSWAVPKVFSYDPSDKRLAVRTEDHPLEYESFDGVIPKGQYGAGTMTIWDRGRYELLNGPDSQKALDEGKLELRLYGGRLRGDWHMVRLKKDPRSWLLFKSRDLYARGKDDPVFAIDVTTAKKSPLPRRVQLMRPDKTSKPFNNPDWLFELDLAGERVLVEKQDEQLRFRATARRNLGRLLPHIVDDLQRVKAETYLIDGVLVCLDAQQRPGREALWRSLQGESDDPVQLYAFDLLYYEEWDLRSFPLSERKAGLSAILPQSKNLIYVDHERSRAEELFETVRSARLPGVIAKRASSPYARGKSPDWLAIPSDPSTADDGSDLMTALKSTKRRPSTDQHKVKFTNRQKVLWPRQGITKGDLIDYYDHVADYLLPYLKDRPLSLKRYPNGIEGHSFFQKDTPEHAPEWLQTVVIKSEKRKGIQNRFLLCNDRASLLYLGNQAAIELHPFSSRCGSLDHPDWAIFDLDPSSDDFSKVVKIARELGKLLRGIGLNASLKTSGSKGLHIYVALAPRYTYDQARIFCEGLARLVAFEHRDIATIERSKERRGGKVYIDFMQNRRGQTIAAPYIARPVPGATVSAPLDWDELNSELSPAQFTLQTMPHRIAQVGDLFRPAITDAQDLLPAIEAFQKLVS